MGSAVVEAGTRERAAQIFASTTQAGVHRVEIATEHVCDLRRTQPLELGEHVDLAPLRAQLVDRRGDPLEAMAGIGSRLDRPLLLGLGQRLDPPSMPLERPSPRRRDTPRDATEPRPDRPFVPGPEPAMHDHEHILRSVLELLGSDAERPQNPPHEREVLGVDRLELGREVVLDGSGHPLSTITSSSAFYPKLSIKPANQAGFLLAASIASLRSIPRTFAVKNASAPA